MTDLHTERLMANDERAKVLHLQRLEMLRGEQASRARRRAREEATLNDALLREERAEDVRLAVRQLCAPLLDPRLNGGLPIDEVLEGALAWVAGTLDCQPLDEPAGLKVRRLGRRMADETIVF
ncbi:MAG: hypothetical protein ACRYGP_26715 [Janthinobacterium lividum]